ncbi:hypothetical protein GIB67_023060 [Kingdonia uniflora]|uniref:Cytochrome P450 n=1 Tax=Kingdonia uniflora TaxID=39325 RepID=A0A7J7P875_9MAGN|nr:hypothetical protein GIB67_023060 [Kingdonia uniflora]
MVQVLFAQQWLERLDEIMSNNILLCVVLLLVSLFFLLKLNGVFSRKLNLPPSPPRLPLIGNLHQIGPYPHRSCQDLAKKYGPIMLLHLGQAKTLIVSSPDIARKITMTQDIDFSSRPFTHVVGVIMHGYKNVSFSPYGEYWRQVKKIFGQGLLNLSKVQSFKHVREEEMALMMEKISRSCSQQTPVDLSGMIRSVLNKIFCRCALTTNNDEESEALAKLYTEVSLILGAFSFADHFPLFGWMDMLTGLRWRLKRVIKKSDTFFEQLIEERISRRKHDDGDDNNKDLLDLLLQKDNNLGRDNIKALLMDLFLGGDDTSITLEWAFTELFNNPKAMKKAQEEVRRVVGTKSKVQEEDIPKMEYLKCVVKEALRLHCPGPMLLPRVTFQGSKVNGYDIPPNTTVMINVYVFQRDPDVYENPEEFIPDRFLNSNIDFRGQDYDLIPFGSGRRGCPGISFALAVVELVLANFLFHFNWKLPGDLKQLDMTEGIGIAFSKKIPLELVPVILSS